MKYKILLIEDNLEMRENTAEILELANYEVITAKDGKEGVTLATDVLPDIIICDIMMPELDGYGVLHILSKNPITAGIPIIFLTAKTDKEDIRKGMSIGADDYITKPYNETDLLNSIEGRIKRKEILKSSLIGEEVSIGNFYNQAKVDNAYEKLTKNRIIKKYDKKEMVFLEGGQPLSAYFILKGEIKIYRTDENDKELITEVKKQGEFFGFLPMLKDCTYPGSAETVEKTELSLIPKNDFLLFLYKNRDVSYQFIKLLSGNIMDKEKELLSLAYTPVKIRVANTLLRLHGLYENDERYISIPREDLASMVGTSTESVIRALSEFKDSKEIEIKGRKVRICDYPLFKKSYAL